ncbi:MAG: hypothetical protein HY722_11130 [Planctomycetes bacterium]|nr:hypothetical protein [Planctomycetota bacterium]
MTRWAPSPLLGNPIADVVNLLDGLRIPYVGTGSVAYSAWAVPASTKDVDIVVHASRTQFARLFHAMAAQGVPIDPQQAIRDIDADRLTVAPMPIADVGHFPVELIAPKLPGIDQDVLARALTVPYPDARKGFKVVTPEDYVVFKLIFFRRKDQAPVQDVLARFPGLDLPYIVRQLRRIYARRDPRLVWFAQELRAVGKVMPNPARRARRP